MIEYHPSFAARARDLCYLGAPDAEIAKLLGVAVATLKGWRERYPEFNYAWEDGQYHASVKVVASLHKRALGYDKLVWKETKDGTFQEMIHVPASMPAIAFWLTNKNPDQWKSRVEHEVGAGGIIPVDALTELETARRIAFILSKAINESRGIENGNSTVPVKTVK